MLDGGPSRTQRARSAYSAGQPSSPVGIRREDSEVPERPQEVEPAESYQPTVKPSGKEKRSNFLRPLMAVLAVVLILGLGLYIYKSLNNDSALGSVIDSRKYQAVFLSDGQIYFGKVESVNERFLKLAEVFYIQPKDEDKTAKDQNQETSGNSDMKLIKRGNEIHGPEDSMAINSDQILFIEDLKPGGKVAQAIEKFHQGNR